MQSGKIKNEAIHQYLEYTKDTEPPTIFHIWSLLASSSAALGRHCFYPFGGSSIYGNLYVLLIGPPASRKSRASGIAANLLRSDTSVRFAPDDTGGQRQGLISALSGESDIVSKFGDVFDDFEGSKPAGKSLQAPKSDKECLFIYASEWGSFIGQNNMDLTRFLNKVYDGEPYQYRLKKEEMWLRNPVCSMLGGTTTSEISLLLPPEAIGQGFTSRIILVYADGPRKKIRKPRLRVFPGQKIRKTLKKISTELEGDFKETEAADEMLEFIYHEVEPAISDSRLMYYKDRRYIHLLKVVMNLAALRGSLTIEVQDIEDADYLLSETEKRMPEALGEFGTAPLARAKQRILDYLKLFAKPVPLRVVQGMMERDGLKKMEAADAINDIINSDLVEIIPTSSGDSLIYKNDLSVLEDVLIGDD